WLENGGSGNRHFDAEPAKSVERAERQRPDRTLQKFVHSIRNNDLPRAGMMFRCSRFIHRSSTEIVGGICIIFRAQDTPGNVSDGEADLHRESKFSINCLTAWVFAKPLLNIRSGDQRDQCSGSCIRFDWEKRHNAIACETDD